jgi:hypothetical protein
MGCRGLPGVEKVPYLGDLMPEEAERGRRRKRESTRLKFRHELAKLAQGSSGAAGDNIDAPDVEREKLGKKTPQEQQIPHHLLLDGNPAPIPEGMQKIIEEICEDLGCIPSAYLAVSDEMSGHSFRPFVASRKTKCCRSTPKARGMCSPSTGKGFLLLMSGTIGARDTERGGLF